MSDLKTLMTHARVMAEPGAHLDGCGARYAFAWELGRNEDGRSVSLRGAWTTCDNPDPHSEHDWETVHSNGIEEIRSRSRCEGVCAGCVPAADRKLWRQIADEVGAHLDRPNDDAQESLI